MNSWAETRLKNSLFRAIMKVETAKTELKEAETAYDKLYREVERRAAWNTKRRQARKARK